MLTFRYNKNPEGSDMFENVSPSEPGADSVPLDQNTPTAEEAGQYEQLNIGKDADEYDDVKVYQRLKVL